MLDKITFGGGDTNIYDYTMLDPINFIDYAGLYTEKFFAGILSTGNQAVLGTVVPLFCKPNWHHILGSRTSPGGSSWT